MTEVWLCFGLILCFHRPISRAAPHRPRRGRKMFGPRRVNPVGAPMGTGYPNTAAMMKAGDLGRGRSREGAVCRVAAPRGRRRPVSAAVLTGSGPLGGKTPGFTYSD
ncbi:hypothetical protein [Spirillospora sp. NBC_01491]|uniref:hypothetical protein n=1 Tax=Spirillospora sp. NBC_01491 TaxID=2976007 RepID=UPI002E32D2FC|nr:hypothetical protein [Spirillospora sp. NBC_01491]